MKRLNYAKSWLMLISLMLLAFEALAQQGCYIDNGGSFLAHQPDCDSKWKIRGN